jgi:hypothetical protein
MTSCAVFPSAARTIQLPALERRRLGRVTGERQSQRDQPEQEAATATNLARELWKLCRELRAIGPQGLDGEGGDLVSAC